ncbi:MAG TPA: histidine kinase [Chitinophagaceae bacterium]|nr:histidine kinase [Chitinophagaceae bacterium]
MENNVFYGIIVATIVIFLLTIGIAMVVLLARKQHVTHELKVSKIELASLRAQMNPHFIFNCLKSIKVLTEQNNCEEASLYLSKFSRLMRNILEQSRDEESILTKEIETLRLYLEMESLRIKEKMTWSINIEEGLDIDFIKVPSLLIQPYVENAIWHGIMHIQGQGTLAVHLKAGPRAGDLVVEVTDNGIGRERSAVINAGKMNKPQSLSTKINQERIELINLKQGVNAGVQIIDLVDRQQASGTKVIIRFMAEH